MRTASSFEGVGDVVAGERADATSSLTHDAPVECRITPSANPYMVSSRIGRPCLSVTGTGLLSYIRPVGDGLCSSGLDEMRAYRPYRLKELKSHYRLDDLPTRKAHIVETLLLGAVITLLVSRRLLQAVRERLRRTPYKMPEQHWGAIFAAAAPAILDIVLLPSRVSKVIARCLESMLLHEAPDPNRSRQLLIERVESGAAWA